MKIGVRILLSSKQQTTFVLSCDLHVARYHHIRSRMFAAQTVNLATTDRSLVRALRAALLDNAIAHGSKRLLPSARRAFISTALVRTGVHKAAAPSARSLALRLQNQYSRQYVSHRVQRVTFGLQRGTQTGPRCLARKQTGSQPSVRSSGSIQRPISMMEGLGISKLDLDKRARKFDAHASKLAAAEARKAEKERLVQERAQARKQAHEEAIAELRRRQAEEAEQVRGDATKLAKPGTFAFCA